MRFLIVVLLLGLAACPFEFDCSSAGVDCTCKGECACEEKNETLLCEFMCDPDGGIVDGGGVDKFPDAAAPDASTKLDDATVDAGFDCRVACLDQCMPGDRDCSVLCHTECG